MLCQGVERLPEGHEWRYELKLDGFRAIGRKAGRTAQLWSRNQKNFARRFPSVVKTLPALPDDTVIDGEVVALDEQGKPSFDLLQGLGTGEPLIVMYAFDLLMLRGRDVRSWPLEERRAELREVIKQLPDTVRYSETFRVQLADLERVVREHRLEGIVAKRAGSPYRSGERCGDWLKWRANCDQEFVIGGYIPMAPSPIRYWSGTTRAEISCMRPVSAPVSHQSSVASYCRTSRSCGRPAVHSPICPNAARAAGAKGSRPPRWPRAAGSTRSWSLESSSSSGRRRTGCGTRALLVFAATHMRARSCANQQYQQGRVFLRWREHPQHSPAHPTNSLSRPPPTTRPILGGFMERRAKTRLPAGRVGRWRGPGFE